MQVKQIVECRNESSLQALAIALLLCALLIFVSMTCFTPIYESNDDVFFSMVASGLGYERAPDYHLAFMHILIGKVLSSLYAKNFHLPWYAMFITACNSLSCVIISFCFVWKKEILRASALFLLFFVFAIMHVLLFLQFTTASALMCIAGLALLLRLSESGVSGYSSYSAPIALLVFASMVRISTFQLFALLGVILFTTKRISSIKQRTSALAAIAISFVLASALHLWHDSVLQSDEGWKHYQSFIAILTPFQDYGYGKALYNGSEAGRLVNWTKDDGLMLASWNLLDRDNFSVENLQKVYKNMRPGEVFGTSKLQQLQKIIEDASVWPMTFICFLSALFMNREQRLRYLIFMLANFALIFSIAFFLKVAARVYIPMFCLSTVVALLELLSDRPAEHIQGQFSRYVTRASTLWAALAVLLTVGSIQWLNLIFLIPERVRKLDQKALISAIARLHPSRENCYVALLFPYESILPFDDLTKYFSTLILCPTGGLSQSPVVSDVTARFGIHKVWLEIDNPALRFLSIANYNTNMQQYLEHHYGKKFVSERVSPFVDAYGVSIDVWRFKLCHGDR